MRSIAIFYASEGTGHRAAAEALRDWFLLQNPGGRVICRDVLDYLPLWLHKLVSDGYLFMARYAPWAWGWFYWGSDKPSFQAAAFERIHAALCRRYLPKAEREIEAIKAEAAVFTHYFGAAHLARRNIGNFPVYYVNTDFISHRFQRDKAFRASFTASPKAVAQYEEDGMETVFDTGIPVSPKFASLSSKAAARTKLGLDTRRTVIVVSGGGIGAGSVLSVTDSLARHAEWDIVVICGKNASLYRRLSARFRGIRSVRIERFVSNMEDYYGSADLCIMKPGGLSLSEALAAGLPLLLMDPIPGQEQLNMDYLCGLGAAAALQDAARADIEAQKLLLDHKKLTDMKLAAAKLSRPKAGLSILEKIEETSHKAFAPDPPKISTY